jgi:uncharacterized protein
MGRVFLDANVLFSAAYRAGSGLVALWRLNTPQLRTSAYALSEAERNLAREDQRRRLAALVRSCEIVPTPSLVRLPPQVILPDNDEPILLAAIAAEATHLLTGDKAHFGRYYGTRLAGVLRPPTGRVPAAASVEISSCRSGECQDRGSSTIEKWQK